LESLQALGAVSRNAGTSSTPSDWSAEPPEKVLAALSLRRRRRPDHGTDSPARLRLRATTTLAEAGAIELGSGLVHLPSREMTRRRLAALISVARHEHLASNPEPVFDASAVQAAAPMDRLLNDRGVRVRVLGVQSPEPAITSEWREPNQARMVYREAAEVSMKLIVIDRQVALFPVDPLNFERGYIEITQGAVVQSLVSSFEQQWATAQDPAETEMPKITLSPREQALIALLTHGNTDASAARELRISERSVSNIVRSLMDRLGVENRFQLGVALGVLRAAPHPPGLAAMTSKPAPNPAPAPDEEQANEE
jgi:DNA-binding CsgD family transcriptional regulator